MTGALSPATPAQVLVYARRLALRYPGRLATAVALHLAAVAAGLMVPRLLGDIVERAARGDGGVGRLLGYMVGFLLLQALLVRFALATTSRLGEQVLADLREAFVDDLLALPLATVEHTGTGELYTRSTRDVDLLSRSVRQAIPDTLVAVLTIGLTVVGLLLTSPVLALACLVTAPPLWFATRWYLRRARSAYLSVAAGYSRVAGGISETVDGAATVEAMRLGPRRMSRLASDIDEALAAERGTLRLRSIYLPIADISFVLPVVAALILGGLLYLDGAVSLAGVTAATFYTQQLTGPLDRLLFWMNEVQTGAASLARLLAVREAAASAPSVRDVADDSGERTTHPGIRLSGVSFAYTRNRQVLMDLRLDIRPGERLAIVGPSGAGKSTLGRLIAGVHSPTSGQITIDGRPIGLIPFSQLRREVVLVTQEQYVFHGTIRENLVIVRPDATDAEIDAALQAVGAQAWATELGLDHASRSGHLPLTPAQAQQLALARVLLADPHTLVLDEATSLLAPRGARHLERSIATVLAGRTVIAIAHRLHTAHDADRIAVMRDGTIIELGSHDELLAQGEVYASLWRSWSGERDGGSRSRRLGAEQAGTHG